MFSIKEGDLQLDVSILEYESVMNSMPHLERTKGVENRLD